MERKQGSRTVAGAPEEFGEVYEGHLGGCALLGDGATYYPRMWEAMVTRYDVKSMIDVGCGAGYALDYFKDLGVKVLGVEGCQEALDNNLVSPEELVKHDYENDGVYAPDQEFDLCWSCEFVEHVTAAEMPNFIETFKSAKIVAITYAYPGQGGHHHVNEQHEPYWLNVMHNAGFRYLAADTAEMRAIAALDSQKHSPFYEGHFVRRGLIFSR